MCIEKGERKGKVPMVCYSLSLPLGVYTHSTVLEGASPNLMDLILDHGGHYGSLVFKIIGFTWPNRAVLCTESHFAKFWFLGS